MVRIVAGRHRGRRLVVPRGTTVRPTSDRAREGLFNVLAHAPLGAAGDSPIHNANVLDAFAGTGALGLEAVSRGAAHATFMERDHRALECLRANIAALGENARTRTLPVDAAHPPPAPAPCHLVFLDPPYGAGLAARALAALAAAGWLAPGALCVVEHAGAEAFEPPPGFTPVAARRYGKARFALLRY